MANSARSGGSLAIWRFQPDEGRLLEGGYGFIQASLGLRGLKGLALVVEGTS